MTATPSTSAEWHMADPQDDDDSAITADASWVDGDNEKKSTKKKRKNKKSKPSSSASSLMNTSTTTVDTITEMSIVSEDPVDWASEENMDPLATAAGSGGDRDDHHDDDDLEKGKSSRGGRGGGRDGILKEDAETKKKPLCSCCSLLMLLISCTSIGLFCYFAMEQKNLLYLDNKAFVETTVFYFAHAGLAALFLVHWLTCFPGKVLSFFGLVLAVWSGVYVYQSSLRLSETPKYDEDNVGSYSHRFGSEFEEVALEVAGTTLALINALWHGFVVRCFSQRK